MLESILSSGQVVNAFDCAPNPRFNAPSQGKVFSLFTLLPLGDQVRAERAWKYKIANLEPFIFCF